MSNLYNVIFKFFLQHKKLVFLRVRLSLTIFVENVEFHFRNNEGHVTLLYLLLCLAALSIIRFLFINYIIILYSLYILNYNIIFLCDCVHWRRGFTGGYPEVLPHFTKPLFLVKLAVFFCCIIFQYIFYIINI